MADDDENYASSILYNNYLELKIIINSLTFTDLVHKRNYQLHCAYTDMVQAITLLFR